MRNVLLACAFVSVAAVPEASWVPSEISPQRHPIRILVTKTGWRGGSDALVINDRAEVSRIYDLLAGNQRLGFTCGFHWNLLFQYDGGKPESIDLNEACEEFRRNQKVVWRELSRVMARAKKHPTHHIVEVAARSASEASELKRPLEKFGFVFIEPDGKNLFVASRTSWTPQRIRAIRAVAGTAAVTIPKEYDTGN